MKNYWTDKITSKADLHKRIRKEYLSEENVARAAYSIWEKSGRPDGSVIVKIFGVPLSELHWLEAKLHLEVLADIDADFIWWHSLSLDSPSTEKVTMEQNLHHKENKNE